MMGTSTAPLSSGHVDSSPACIWTCGHSFVVACGHEALQDRHVPCPIAVLVILLYYVVLLLLLVLIQQFGENSEWTLRTVLRRHRSGGNCATHKTSSASLDAKQVSINMSTLQALLTAADISGRSSTINVVNPGRVLARFSRSADRQAHAGTTCSPQSLSSKACFWPRNDPSWRHAKLSSSEGH